MAGVISRGIKCPIFKKGDDVANMIVDSIVKDTNANNYLVQDNDIIAVTESVVARVEGNYATIDDIARDIKRQYSNPESLGILFPILSRNRFSILLKGMARATKRIIVQFNIPTDEVGNQIVNSIYDYYTKNVEKDFTEEEFIKTFGKPCHPFTGVNYIDLYREVVEGEGCKFECVFSANPLYITHFTSNILIATTHSREILRSIFLENDYHRVRTMADILATPAMLGGGYNSDWGILGSNKATEDTVKLFPRRDFCQTVIDQIASLVYHQLGKRVEVMVYGDGAFKDPVGQIWELADPVVSPSYTRGLEGTPNEVKLKYLADNKFASLTGKELEAAIKDEIAKKDIALKGQMITQGTTPRRYTDLLGSLSDLTSGSGDRGTPVVLIQNYFTNYSD